MNESARVRSGTGECDWLLWQLADSAFPTGGFAHSGGLEAAWQHKLVRNRSDLMAFLENALGQLGRGSLPFVQAGVAGERRFSEIDWLCDAFTSNHVANRASRAQGRALLAAAERAFNNARLRDLRAEMLEQELPGHYAPVFGSVARELEMPGPTATRLFIFLQLRGWISSGVRLGIIGPLEGQKIQHELSSRTEEIANAFAGAGLEEIAQTAPLLDLLQGTQDRLYSRLFQS